MPKDKGNPESSILYGVDEIINRRLGLFERIGEKTPHYKHRTSFLKLSQKPVSDFDGESLIKDIYKEIKFNWNTSRKPSKENWRWKPNFAKEDQAKEENRKKKLEVRLERAIVGSEKVWDSTKNWANQVPTASGLVNEYSDKRGAIDLIYRRTKSEYEFIELKVSLKGGHPLYAQWKYCNMAFSISSRKRIGRCLGTKKRRILYFGQRTFI
jgi:hypothetical protein